MLTASRSQRRLVMVLTCLVLGVCLSDPATSLEAYAALRDNFIGTYKRDVPKNDAETDRSIIAAGNI